MSDRLDLSNWIIHFIHDRNPENYMYSEIKYNKEWEIEDYIYDSYNNILPKNFDYNWELIEYFQDYQEDLVLIEDDISAFYILKKILIDWYIQTFWSIRNGKSTIYWPKSVVCFTEMPLYSLLEYVTKRADKSSVNHYGIAFLKNELFWFWARPIIYWVSTDHKEANENDIFFGKWLRTLSSNLWIGLKEQYRYVYTNLNWGKKIDWIHERERRWADIEEKYSVPWIPFLLEESKKYLAKIIILVSNKEEENEILELLRTLYDSKNNDYWYTYNIDLIKNTFVISIETILNNWIDISKIKLETIDFKSFNNLKDIEVSNELITKVKNICEEASRIWYKTSESKEKEIKDNAYFIPCWYSYIVTDNWNSDIIQALLKAWLASWSGLFYTLNIKSIYASQSYEVNRSGAIAAANFLNDKLWDYFYIRSLYD